MQKYFEIHASFFFTLSVFHSFLKTSYIRGFHFIVKLSFIYAYLEGGGRER